MKEVRNKLQNAPEIFRAQAI